MPTNKLRLNMNHQESSFGFKWVGLEALLLEWDGPLLPVETVILLAPGNELDQIWGKVFGHALESMEPDFELIVFTEISVSEHSIAALTLNQSIFMRFIKGMQDRGWEPYDGSLAGWKEKT